MLVCTVHLTYILCIFRFSNNLHQKLLTVAWFHLELQASKDHQSHHLKKKMHSDFYSSPQNRGRALRKITILKILLHGWDVLPLLGNGACQFKVSFPALRICSIQRSIMALKRKNQMRNLLERGLKLLHWNLFHMLGIVGCYLSQENTLMESVLKIM